MPKRKNPSGHPSHVLPGDIDRFRTANDLDRYGRHFATRPVQLERGFDVYDFQRTAEGLTVLDFIRPWLTLATPYARANLAVVREFYSNAAPTSTGALHTWVRGIDISVTANSLASYLSIPRVEDPQYSPSTAESFGDHIVISTLRGIPGCTWSGRLDQNLMTPVHFLLNMIVCSSLYPRVNNHFITQELVRFEYALVRRMSLDLSSLLLSHMREACNIHIL